MKIRKLAITAVITLAVLALGISAWFFWRQSRNRPGTGAHSDWVFVPQTSWVGALSEQGYYYSSSMILHYCDFATEKHTVLCAKAGCGHEGEACEAFIGPGSDRTMFFGNGCVYYLQHEYDGQHLYRRDATGAALVSIGTPGTYYIKQQKSVDISHLTLAGNYLFYRGKVGTDMGTTVSLDTEFIARMDLATGKEEILIEETMEHPGDHLWLCAVRENAVLFSRFITVRQDETDPDSLTDLQKTVNKLMLWSEEAGEVTTLLQKPLTDFSQVTAVYGGKVFYKSFTTTEPGSGGLYAYDLTSGKDEAWIGGNLQHLGGGYALWQKEDSQGYVLIDLLTKKTLPNALNELANYGSGWERCASGHGVVLRWTGAEHRKENENDEYGYRDEHHDYITYASLADGLQKEDLIPIFTKELYVNDPDYQPPATDPTAPPVTSRPSDPRYAPIDFFTESPVPDEETTKMIQYLPKNIENSDDLPVLKWVCLVENYARVTFTEDAVADLNRMLAEKKMPFRLQIVIATYTWDVDSGYSGLDWFSSPEIQALLKDADLIYASMDPEERKAHLLPITEYATGDAKPSLKNSVLHKLNWLSASCDGEIYGIPASFHYLRNSGWRVSTSLMDKLSLTADDFDREFWEMDELFARIYEANGKKPFLELRTSAGFATTDLRIQGGICDSLPATNQLIGTFFAIDHTAERPTVVNLLELDVLQSIRDAIGRYHAAGYTLTQHDDYDYSQVKVYHGNLALDIPVTYGELLRIPTGVSAYYTGYAGANALTGIAASTENKEEALALLELIAEDETLRNLLLFGREGRDYEIIDGNKSLLQEITPVENVVIEHHPDGNTSTYKEYYDLYTRYDLSFLSGLSKYGTLTNETLYGYPTVEGKTKQQTYLDAMERLTYVDYPICFDFTGFEAELERIGELLAPYWYDLMDPATVSDEVLGQLLKDISAAGGSGLQAELQRQLDAWLAENPDPLAQYGIS